VPDGAIVVPDTHAAPKDYTLAGTQEIALKSVSAEIDGSGAASSYKPTLQLLDPNGHVCWEGEVSDAVAAGASVRASWFPGLGGTGASTGVQWFFASRVTNQGIPFGEHRRISWTHHVTSDSTVFSVTTTVNTDDTVNGLKAGVYIASADMVWASPQNYPHHCLISSDFFNISAAGASPVSSSATEATEVPFEARHVHDSAICLTPSVPGEISLLAFNDDGVAHSVTFATYAIAYFPNSVLVT
jgi:hypothetical protein